MDPTENTSAPAIETGPSPARGWPFLALAAIGIAVGVAFSPAIGGPFLFDDAEAIVANPAVNGPFSLSVALNPPPVTALTGRPTANLSFALNAAVDRALGVHRDAVGLLRADGMRAGNILLHVVAGILLFGLMRRTLRTQSYSAWWAARADGFSLAVVALWLLHPLQTEPVNYVVQRTEILAGCFYAGTLYAWLRGWQASTISRRRTWIVTAVALCLAGMGAKEVMITAPLMVVLYDRAFSGRGWRQLFADRERTTGYIALFATTSVVLYSVATNARESTVGFNAGMSVRDYLLSQGWAIPHYLRLAIWPRGLAIDYGSHPITSFGWSGLLLLTVGFVATLRAWARADKWGWLAFLGSWFYVILAPSSSFVPIVTEIAAERRMYLPLLAVIAVVVIGGADLVRRVASRQSLVLRSVVVVLSAALAATTFIRSRDYRTAEGIWRDAVTKRPDNARAKQNLGAELLIVEPPRLAEAESLFVQSLQQDPRDPGPWFNLGEIALTRGDLVRARAMYERALAVNPTHPKSVARYAQLGGPVTNDSPAMRLAFASRELADAGRTDSAVVLARRAIDQPNVTSDVAGLVASVYMRAGLAPEAEKVLLRATAADSGNAQLWSGLGLSQGTQEKWNAAEKSFRRALSLDPSNADAQRGLQLVLQLREMAAKGRGSVPRD